MPARHVYVHVPFCSRRCSYCDFSIAVRRAVPVDEYLRALQTELALRPGGEIDTLYFGGGTPSKLGGSGVARAVACVLQRFALAPDAEVTIEANPEDVTLEAAAAWFAAGVTRVSLGAQSFDAGALRWMHRSHDPSAVQQAIEALRAAGIANISLDLIFALPSELRRAWPRDLELALSLRPEHISLYGLTVEPATPLARWRDRGAVREAGDDEYEREYLLAHDMLTSAGYEHYEVSNFARPGYRSRHNASYWNGHPYAAFGPSAHRFDGLRRAWNVAPYAAWVTRLEHGDDPTDGTESLSFEQQEIERIYLGLRTSSGIDRDERCDRIYQEWVAAGWARVERGSVALTARGWLRLDALAGVLTAQGSHCNVYT